MSGQPRGNSHHLRLLCNARSLVLLVVLLVRRCRRHVTGVQLGLRGLVLLGVPRRKAAVLLTRQGLLLLLQDHAVVLDILLATASMELLLLTVGLSVRIGATAVPTHGVHRRPTTHAARRLIKREVASLRPAAACLMRVNRPSPEWGKPREKIERWRGGTIPNNMVIPKYASCVPPKPHRRVVRHDLLRLEQKNEGYEQSQTRFSLGLRIHAIMQQMQEQDQDTSSTELLRSRLAEAEALLAEERASKQALRDELVRLRSEKTDGRDAIAVAVGGGVGGGQGSPDGFHKEYGSPQYRHPKAIHENVNDGTSVSAPASAATAADAVEPGVGERGRRRHRGEEERHRPPWQNVLYKRQPYADNHVPDSFLEKLVTNGESFLRVRTGRRELCYAAVACV